MPTLDELGLKGFDADTIFGFYAPAGTPEAVIARLNTEINRSLGDISRIAGETSAIMEQSAAAVGDQLFGRDPARERQPADR